MKRSLLNAMLLILLSGTTGYGQNFILLANDPPGDKKPGSGSAAADIINISYSIDDVQDSIWIKLVTSNPITTNNDFGLMLGIDTNQVTTDGTNWPGANNSMKYDHALFVWMNLIQPGSYYIYRGHPGSSNPVTGTVKRPDNYTFIINTRLSLVDNNGKLNLLGFSSTFDVAFTSTPIVIDEVPNAGDGYMTVPFVCTAPASVGISNVTNTSVTVTWTKVNAAAWYEVVDTVSATPPSSGYTTSATSFTIPQLAPGTQYYAHVRTKCASSSSADWETQPFTTTAVSVGEVASTLQGVQVYPNPGDGHFTVELPGNIRYADVTVLDALGRTIERRTLSQAKTGFDLSDKSKGLYILQVESEGAVYRTKLLVQ